MLEFKNNFTIQEVRDFWNQTANIYDKVNKKIGQAHHQRFTQSLKYLDLKPGHRVLNIWSRTGNAIPYLTQHTQLNLHNLEVSSAMIAIAQKKYPQAQFALTDLNQLEFKDNFFDSILCLETLEHTPRPQQLLDEFYRVLKSDGKLVLSLPPATAEIPLKIYELFFKNHGEGPHQFLPSKLVKKMLSRSGFKLILHQGTLLVPAGPNGLQRLGEKIIERFQQTPLKEFGIRQFYVCKK